MMFYWFHFLNISLIFLIRFRHYPVAQNIEEVWKIKSNDTDDIIPKKDIMTNIIYRRMFSVYQKQPKPQILVILSRLAKNRLR